MKTRVDRARWVNAATCGPQNKTRLRNEQGNMCCLGFACEQAGVPSELLLMQGSPSWLLGDHGLLGYLLVDRGHGQLQNSDLAGRAIAINDSGDYSLSEREQALIELFAEFGHEIEFHGEYSQHGG